MADAPYPPPTYPPSQLHNHSPHHPKGSGVASSTPNNSNLRQHSLPFVFPALSPKITSSTFLIPSNAEGRPIPLDGSTATHRTTTLRQLSRSQPSSRRRYSRASSPPSIKSSTTKTYSEPVVVRTYSSARPSSSTTGPVSVSTVSPASNSSSQHMKRNGIAKSMTRHKRSEKAAAAAAADAKLPPLESFTFKSIIADIQQDVGADLDRIAEICARTKYSLSNQYEVHIAPQGSGAGPSESLLRHHTPVGPTLQTISGDDEHAGPLQKKRRNTARRRSVAYGTLETIIGSSRSSNEDKSKKKPAAQIIEEVSRLTMDTRDEGVSENSIEAQGSSKQRDGRQECLPTRSTLSATAIADTPRNQLHRNMVSPRVPGIVLSSEPARPQTSRNHLQTKTSPLDSTTKYYTHEPPPRPSPVVTSETVGASAITTPEEPAGSSSLLSGFSAWVPWRAVTVPGLTPLDLDSRRFDCNPSYAEGSLRELLKLTKVKNAK